MRKLALAAGSFCAAVFASRYLLSGLWAFVFAGLGTVLFIASFRLKGDARQKAALIGAGAAAGFLWFAAYTSLFVAPVTGLAGSSMTVRAEICGFSEGYYVDARLKTDSLPSARIRIYSYTEPLGPLEPGDIVSFDAALISAETIWGEQTDVFTSRGILLTARPKSALELEGKSALSFLYFPQRIARAVKNTLARDYSADAGGFMTAMLTGDRSLLDGGLSADMGTAGLLHIVAVSGMHVAFLVGLVTTLFGKRRRTAVVCIPVILVFIPMTGANPSVIRAGLMQILVLLAPLFGRESDGLTSLMLALSLLLALNPYSCANAGLQLSFASMAGIILITPRVGKAARPLYEKRTREKSVARSVCRYIAGSLATTIGVMAFTVPLTALHFGYVSLVAPVTNIICLGILSLCFSLGYGIFLIGLIAPVLAQALAWVLTWPLRFVFLAARALAGIPNSAVYTSNNIVAWWLVYVYALVAVCYLLRGKKGFRPLFPLCLSVCALSAVLVISSVSAGAGSGTLAVLDVGQGQSVVVTGKDGTVVIDCGGYGRSNAGDVTADFLLANGRREVDLLVLTHLHADHANGVLKLFSRVGVRRLMIPEDIDPDDEDGLYDRVVSAALNEGIEIIVIDEDLTLDVGSVGLRIFAPVGADEVNERGLVARVSLGEFDALITGDINSTSERRLLAYADIGETEFLVAGHHGSRYSTSLELLDELRPDAAAVSVGNNGYGHPTRETLLRLFDAGAAIFRTDLQGTITIKVA